MIVKEIIFKNFKVNLMEYYLEKILSILVYTELIFWRRSIQSKIGTAIQSSWCRQGITKFKWQSCDIEWRFKLQQVKRRWRILFKSQNKFQKIVYDIGLVRTPKMNITDILPFFGSILQIYNWSFLIIFPQF